MPGIFGAIKTEFKQQTNKQTNKYYGISKIQCQAFLKLGGEFGAAGDE